MFREASRAVDSRVLESGLGDFLQLASGWSGHRYAYGILLQHTLTPDTGVLLYHTIPQPMSENVHDAFMHPHSCHGEPHISHVSSHVSNASVCTQHPV